MLKILKSTIDRHKQRLRLVKKRDIWMPHELKEIHFTKRMNACDLYLKHNEFDPFFKRIITGDGKYIVYNKVVRNDHVHGHGPWPPQTTSKAELHQKRLCCLFSGIGKVRYFLSCFQGTKRLIRTSTVVSWTNWTQWSKKSSQYWSIVKV